MEKLIDCYKLLGIRFSAGIEEIKKAYEFRKKRVKDKQKQKLLDQAFYILTNEHLKLIYDEEIYPKLFKSKNKKIPEFEKKYLQGIMHFLFNNLEEAEKKFIEALKLKDDEPAIYESLGLTYKMLSIPDKAIDAYEKAIMLSPLQLENYLYLAELYVEEEDYDSAENVVKAGIDVADKILSEHPESIETLRVKAELHLMLDEVDKAVKYYKKAISLDKSNLELHMGLADLYYSEGRLDEAIEVLQKAKKIAPENSSIYLNLGLIYNEANMLSKAIRALQKSLKLNPYQKDVEDLLDKLRTIKKEVGRTIEEVILAGKYDEEIKGVVQWYNEEKGIGFIKPGKKSKNEPSIFLHFRAIPKEETVSAGEPVIVKVKYTDAGPVAVSIKKLLLERKASSRLKGKIVSIDKKKGFGIIKAFDETLDEVIFFLNQTGNLDLKAGQLVEFEVTEVESLSDRKIVQAKNIVLVELE